jgi:hypothetical protein
MTSQTPFVDLQVWFDPENEGSWHWCFLVDHEYVAEGWAQDAYMAIGQAMGRYFIWQLTTEECR